MRPAPCAGEAAGALRRSVPEAIGLPGRAPRCRSAMWLLAAWVLLSAVGAGEFSPPPLSFFPPLPLPSLPRPPDPRRRSPTPAFVRGKSPGTAPGGEEGCKGRRIEPPLPARAGVWVGVALAGGRGRDASLEAAGPAGRTARSGAERLLPALSPLLWGAAAPSAPPGAEALVASVRSSWLSVVTAGSPSAGGDAGRVLLQLPALPLPCSSLGVGGSVILAAIAGERRDTVTSAKLLVFFCG